MVVVCINMENPRPKRHRCEECAFATNRRKDFLCHQRKHTGEKPFSCQFCGKSFSLKTNRGRHELTHSKETRYKCAECSAEFSEKGSLQKHLRLHTGENLFICTTCDAKFTTKSKLESHLPTHTGERPFKCSLCDKAFSRRGCLRSHLRRHNKWNCSNCNISLPNFVEFGKHMKTHADYYKTEKGIPKFVCSVCGKGVTKRCILVDHMRIHTGEKPFQCSSCVKSFRTKNELSTHRKLHALGKRIKTHTDQHQTDSGIPKFVCSVCGKSVSKRSILVDHMRIHTGEKPFQCEACVKCYRTRGELTMHRNKIHLKGSTLQSSKSNLTGTNKSKKLDDTLDPDGYYNCPHCDKRFRKRGSLREHSTVHTEKPMQCDKCNIIFSSACGFKRHMLRHQGVTNSHTYPCPLCDTKFTRRYNAMNHMKSAHAIEAESNVAISDDGSGNLFKCSLCEKPFSRTSSLVMHEVFEHKVVKLWDKGSEAELDDDAVQIEGTEIFIKEEIDCNDRGDDKVCIEKVTECADLDCSEITQDPFSNITIVRKSHSPIKEETVDCVVKEEYDE